jgi:pyruvyltransferase
VPFARKSETLQNAVYDACSDRIIEQGFSNYRRPINGPIPHLVSSRKYRILLSPYIYEWQHNEIDTQFKIMYPYASYYFNKPSWTIKQFIEQDYMADALLSHAVGTQHVTDIFTKTYIVPSLKLMNFKREKKRINKPVLFFAPSYNDMDFLQNILVSIDTLKKKYHIIMRAHNKAVYNKQYSSYTNSLLSMADEVYEAEHYRLIEPLNVSDIVITDNSGVLHDAIYCGIPVAIFSNDINEYSYRDINTSQAELVARGEVLWTNDAAALGGIIKRTLQELQESQRLMRVRLFPDADHPNPIMAWMDVLKVYLNNSLPYEYSLGKKYWVESIQENKRHLQAASESINNLESIINERDKQLSVSNNPSIKVAFRFLVNALKRRLKATIVMLASKLIINPFKYLKYKYRLFYRQFKIRLFKEPIVIYQYVFTDPPSINFGDELTKDIIEKLFKKQVVVHNTPNHQFDLIGVGSLIHFFNDSLNYKTYVWGSGLIDDKVNNINDNFVFKACRGRLTREKLPTKYREIPMGDPGLLCNLIYTKNIKHKDKIGVIPHFRDEKSHYFNKIIKKHPEIFKIIPVGQSPENVANQIRSCRLILSSSLHGLIVADSFGIPNIHLMLSDNLSSPNHLRGGEYKFRDYCSGVGRKYSNFNPRTQDLLNMDEYQNIIKNYEPIQSLVTIQRDLIKAFPY